VSKFHDQKFHDQSVKLNLFDGQNIVIVKVAASSLVFWVSFWIGLTDRWYFGKPGPNKDAKYSVPRCQ